jgi:hypothetical protein
MMYEVWVRYRVLGSRCHFNERLEQGRTGLEMSLLGEGWQKESERRFQEVYINLYFLVANKNCLGMLYGKVFPALKQSLSSFKANPKK